jgi:hypothetical protein
MTLMAGNMQMGFREENFRHLSRYNARLFTARIQISGWSQRLGGAGCKGRSSPAGISDERPQPPLQVCC